MLILERAIQAQAPLPPYSFKELVFLLRRVMCQELLGMAANEDLGSTASYRQAASVSRQTCLPVDQLPHSDALRTCMSPRDT